MARSKMARIEDLVKAAADGRNCQLQCPVCFGTFSANPSDYFWAMAKHAFRCSCTRGRPGLVLVDRR